jgi:hypothetical protein
MQDIRDLVKRHREEAMRARARAANASAAEDREAFLKLAGEWDALAEEWTRQHSETLRAAE